jgi:hypothetical protein
MERGMLCSKASAFVSHRKRSFPTLHRTENAYLFMLTFYSPHDDDEQIVCFVRPNGGN